MTEEPGRRDIGDIEPRRGFDQVGVSVGSILGKGAEHKGLATVAFVAAVWGTYWSVYAGQYSLIELIDGVEPWLYWLWPLLGVSLSALLVSGGLAILKRPRSEPTDVVGPRESSMHRNDKPREQELLEAIERRGEITPARAALETSFTVAEADRMLSELAQGGHLEVRVEEGKLLYRL